MNFAWGMADSGSNIFAECIAGFQFASVTIPFAIYFFGQSMFVTAGTMTTSGLSTPLGYIIFYAVLAVWCIFAFLLFWFTFDMIEDVDPEGELRAEINIRRADDLQSKLD